MYNDDWQSTMIYNSKVNYHHNLADHRDDQDHWNKIKFDQKFKYTLKKGQF